MNIRHLRTLAQVADFLHGRRGLEPVHASQAERYQWIEQTLRHFRYLRRSKADKGLVVAYLGRITGYSRQQLTRLIRRYRDPGHVRWPVCPVNGFTARYNAADVALLAEIDALHDTPSGPAAQKLCERAWTHFGDARYPRLAGISVSHLYNLRRFRDYRGAALLDKLRIDLTKSRARHCNAKALAESKNAAVVRKILGYVPIPQYCAPPVNRFNQNHLNPYVNYHRPCCCPETVTDAKGTQRKRYRYEHMMTP